MTWSGTPPALFTLIGPNPPRWYATTLPTGTASIIFTVTVGAGAAGTITNTVEITSSTQDDVAGNNSGSVSIDVTNADLAVTKSVDDPNPTVGSSVVYTIAVTNGGPVAATSVVVSDTWPMSVTFVSTVTTQGVYDVATGVWDVGTLTSGNGATLTLTGAVISGTVTVGQTITNTAEISALDQFDFITSNNKDSAPITVAGTFALVGESDILYLVPPFLQQRATSALSLPKSVLSLAMSDHRFVWHLMPGRQKSAIVPTSASSAPSGSLAFVEFRKIDTQ